MEICNISFGFYAVPVLQMKDSLSVFFLFLIFKFDSMIAYQKKESYRVIAFEIQNQSYTKQQFEPSQVSYIDKFSPTKWSTLEASNK